MMMMSQSIQPNNNNRSALPANLGSQGFISGRQRLQQQAPVTTPTSTSTYNNTRNQALVTAPSAEAPANLPPTSEVIRTQSNKPALNALPYQEIQKIAQKAGYVGVSHRDIDRAYRLNKSLLVDYRA